MGKLSDRNATVQVVPSPQSPAAAGFLQPYAGAVAPPGWMICDGTVLQQSAYPDLFANIGSGWDAFAHPVDGAPTVNAGEFAIPNLQGLYLGVVGDGGGDLKSLGDFQEDQLQGHRHDGSMLINTGTNIANGAGTFFATPGNTGDPISDGVNGTPRTGAETRPKTACVNYIIKLYSDSADVAVSDALATANAPGNIQLSQAFAAQANVAGLLAKQFEFDVRTVTIVALGGNLSALNFNNIEQGKSYLLGLTNKAGGVANAQSQVVASYPGGTITVGNVGGTAIDDQSSTVTPFVATANGQVTFASSAVGSGNHQLVQAWLLELPSTFQTSKWD